MILLIDTTTNPTAIGLWDEKKIKTKIIESNTENNRKLVGIIEKFIKSNIHNSKFKILDSIGAIGVINGPGAFTGVRTGVTIANTISYALKIPMYSIDTLSAQISVGVDLRVDQNADKRRSLPLRRLNNVVSLLSASNTEVYFARFEKGKMQKGINPDPNGRGIEIVDIMNLQNRLKKGDLIVGDLQEKHCGIWGSNEFRKVDSSQRIETLLQMIIDNKIRPIKQVLPLYIKKPNITIKKK